jgi:hypothetical protein
MMAYLIEQTRGKILLLITTKMGITGFRITSVMCVNRSYAIVANL